MKKRYKAVKKTRRLSAIFREAAQRIQENEDSGLRQIGMEYYACNAVKNVLGVDTCRFAADDDRAGTVLAYYEKVLVGHDVTFFSGWFGWVNPESQQQRVISLLLAAEFYGDKKITYEC